MYLTCSVEKLDFLKKKTLAPVNSMLYIIGDEHNYQVATEGAGRSMACCPTQVVSLPPSLQSAEVHPTPTLCLPGT
jgi:hypothetical protein